MAPPPRSRDELAQSDRILLWDLDGTIADTRRDIATAVAETLRELGHPPLALEQVIRNVGRGVRVLMARCLEDVGHPARSDGEIDQAVLIFRRHYLRHLMDTTQPYPQMMEMLRELKARGRRMAIVSNKPEDATRELALRLGLAELFVTILGGDSVGARKPSPEPLLHALRLCREDARPDEAALIGDSIIDLQAGRAAGIPVCSVAWGYDPDGALRAEAPDWRMETPEELRRVLLRETEGTSDTR